MRTSEGLRGAARPLLAIAAATAAAAGCSPVRAQEAAKPPAVELTAEDVPMSRAAENGRGVYRRWCVGCHGETGRGDGPAAAWLDPLPRNFQSGRFKFRSTPSGTLPTTDDLVRTINRGLRGSSMPAFPLLPEPEKRDVAEYVLWLAEIGRARTEVESIVAEDGLTVERARAERMGGIRERLAERRAAAKPVGIPPEPPPTPEIVARGKALYTQSCESCHGASGTGDGNSSGALRDSLDARIVPRDFTVGRLRGGDTPQDLFRRLRTGLDGTPMPSYGDPDDDLWAIVYYVMTLRRDTGAQEAPR